MVEQYLKGSKFRKFSGQFAKISSREMSQGQSLAKINSREKKFGNCQIRENTFLDCDIDPNDDI